MLKALLSDLGAAFHKTHELGRLMAVEDRLRMRSLSQPT
jgi:hypothetical protein